MKDRKFIRLVATLSDAEWKRFGKYVRSPYFNERSGPVLIYTWLSRFYPDFNQKQCTPESLYKDLYKSDKFSSNKLNKQISYFFDLLEAFIVAEGHRESTTHPFLHLRMQFSFYTDRGLDRLAVSKRREIERMHDEYENRNFVWLEERYQNQLLFADCARKYPGKYEAVGLEEVNEALNETFLISKLKHLCVMLSEELRIKQKYPKPMLAAVVGMLEDSSLRQQPAIEIHYLSVLLLMEVTEENYKALKESLQKNGKALGRKALHGVYLHLGACSQHVFRHDKRRFYEERLELYQHQLSENLLTPEGRIAARTYKNIVFLGLNTGQLDWVQNFMETYKGNLASEERDSVYNLNLALLEFFKGRYNVSQELLLVMDHKDIFYELTAKRLLAMIYYEQEEWIALRNYLNSFKVYVFRRKERLSESYFQSDDNFVKMLLKLLGIRESPNPDPEAVQRLGKILREQSLLNEKLWLTEKLQQLQKT